EADRLGGAGRGAGGLLALDQAIVAQSALAGGAHPIDLLVTIRVRRDGAVVAPLDHSEGAGAHTGAAAVADGLLHHHRAVLRPADRPRGAHVQAAGVRAVLAHVRGHQPADLGRARGCAIGAGEVARRGRPAGAGDLGPMPGMPRLTSFRPDSRASSIRSWPCSTKATCRQVLAPSSPVLS